MGLMHDAYPQIRLSFRWSLMLKSGVLYHIYVRQDVVIYTLSFYILFFNHRLSYIVEMFKAIFAC